MPRTKDYGRLPENNPAFQMSRIGIRQASSNLENPAKKIHKTNNDKGFEVSMSQENRC